MGLERGKGSERWVASLADVPANIVVHDFDPLGRLSTADTVDYTFEVSSCRNHLAAATS